MGSIKFSVIKRSAILVAILCAVMFGVAFISTNNCYAKTYVTDNHVQAVINDDGISGTLYFNDNTYYKADAELGYTTPALTSIGDTPLKDIIKFKNGGYVSSISVHYGNGACTAKTYVDVNAAGPSTFFNQGDLVFYDASGNRGGIGVWRHDELGYRTALPGISGMGKVVKMVWY